MPNRAFLSLVALAVLAVGGSADAQSTRGRLGGRRAGRAQGAQVPDELLGRFGVTPPHAVLLSDPARPGRQIDLDVYVPEGDTAALPVVIFSPGYGGTKKTGAAPGQIWASHGYAVITVTHPGSDITAVKSLMKAHPFRALNPRKFVQEGTGDPVAWLDRAKDLRLIVDRLGLIADSSGARLDTTRIAITGHSMGAFASMTAAGATFDVPDSLGGAGRYFRDPRVKTFVFFSPQGPDAFGLTPHSYSRITGSATLTVTGTRDSGQGGQSYTWRLTPYDSMPAEGNDYAMVMQGAMHSSFLNDARYMTPAFSLATRFLDAYLAGDAQAFATLRSGKIVLGDGVQLTRK